VISDRPLTSSAKSASSFCLREQKVNMERVRFELDAADLVMKHIDRLEIL
jgi:hypothetical protein